MSKSYNEVVPFRGVKKVTKAPAMKEAKNPKALLKVVQTVIVKVTRNQSLKQR